MIAIEMPMPYMCSIGKGNGCPLADDYGNCNLLPESDNYLTIAEQFAHCPLIDLSQYEDDGK